MRQSAPLFSQLCRLPPTEISCARPWIAVQGHPCILFCQLHDRFRLGNYPRLLRPLREGPEQAQIIPASPLLPRSTFCFEVSQNSIWSWCPHLIPWCVVTQFSRVLPASLLDCGINPEPAVIVQSECPSSWI